MLYSQSRKVRPRWRLKRNREVRQARRVLLPLRVTGTLRKRSKPSGSTERTTTTSPSPKHGQSSSFSELNDWYGRNSKTLKSTRSSLPYSATSSLETSTKNSSKPVHFRRLKQRCTPKSF